MRVLVLTGMPGAGKSTVSNIARSMGILTVSMGDAVRHELARRGLESTVQNFDFLTQELRKERGPTAVAQLTYEMISELDQASIDTLVIDGMRSQSELEAVRSWPFVDSATVLAVLSSFSDRFTRLYGRGRAGDPKSLHELHERDSVELSFGLGNLIALSDMYLVNDAGLEEFSAAASQKLRAWLSAEAKKA